MNRVFSTVGNRLLVDDIVSELSLEQRAAKSGLEIVVAKENRPRNTSAFIVGLGDDPFLWEEIIVNGIKRPRYQLGDKVFFAWSAGIEQLIDGHSFRCIEAHEVTGIERELPPPPDSSQEDTPSPESALAAQSEPDPPEEQPQDQFGTSYPESWPASPVYKDPGKLK